MIPLIPRKAPAPCAASRATRLFAALAVLLAAASCAHRAGRGEGEGRTVDPAAPPKSAFELYPAQEISGVKDPHDYKGKALCQRCHDRSLRLTNGPNALCLECHKLGHGGSHPVDVVQKAAVLELPLAEGGKVACHTCHDPHQKKKVLRKSFNDLCTSCHPRH